MVKGRRKGFAGTYWLGLQLAAVLSLVSGAANAATSGSVHDSRNWFGSDQVCNMCHTPHNAKADTTPLWNHTLSAATYTLYGSPTMNATAGQPGPVSKLCLSCHDGTVGINDFGGSQVGPGGIKFSQGDRSYIGTQLGNDHPVGIDYTTALAAGDGNLADPATKNVTVGSTTTKTGTIAAVLLVNGKVECSTCHDAHDVLTDGRNLVKISMSGSALCMQCHTK
jgi:predicted CXXCH cytochrome family protein